MPQARSNSYNFAPVRDVSRPQGAPCPLPETGELARDVPRELFVRFADRMRLFRTETTDFTDAELTAIKEQVGQIYADVSTKLAPDDFARDLRKLALTAECRACPLRAECGGCWQASSRATYLGVDPDAGRVDVLRSRHPWARYHVGTVSDVSAAEPRFDHVLVLRSYNHLARPVEDLGDAVGRLVVGGTLLIVDNVAFGLVRTQEQAARAESGPAELEHYRNDSSEQAEAALSDLPLHLVERRDVGAETSNQWLLRYEKTQEAIR